MPPLVKGEVLSPEKIRATTGGIAAPLSLAPHQPSRTRTIPCFAPTPLPLNERSVGFASALSPRSSPTLPKPHYPTKIATTLASPRKRVRFCCSVKPSQLWWGLLPIRTINEIFRTIPSPRTKLASLVKSEVLSPDKIRATTGGIAHQPLHPHNFLKSTSIASPRTITLASLVKGEVLSPEKIRATTGGIALHHQPFQNRTIPRKSPPPLPPLEKGEVARLI